MSREFTRGRASFSVAGGQVAGARVHVYLQAETNSGPVGYSTDLEPRCFRACHVEVASDCIEVDQVAQAIGKPVWNGVRPSNGVWSTPPSQPALLRRSVELPKIKMGEGRRLAPVAALALFGICLRKQMTRSRARSQFGCSHDIMCGAERQVVLEQRQLESANRLRAPAVARVSMRGEDGVRIVWACAFSCSSLRHKSACRGRHAECALILARPDHKKSSTVADDVSSRPDKNVGTSGRWVGGCRDAVGPAPVDRSTTLTWL